jgi:hypothetical protein
MKMAIACLITLAAATAQDDKTYLTGEMLNGRYWQNLSKGEKTAFLVGYEQAVVVCFAENDKYSSGEESLLLFARCTLWA